jgi:hypothetical protein
MRAPRERDLAVPRHHGQSEDARLIRRRAGRSAHSEISDGLSALKRMRMPKYLPKDAPRNRIREATRARENRLQIVRALSRGEATRGAFQMGAVYRPAPRAARCLVPASSLSRCTGWKCRGRPLALTRDASGDPLFPAACNEPKAKRLCFHSDFNACKAANPGQPTRADPFCNPINKRAPMEGRPPGEVFAHQRWDECVPEGRLCPLARRNRRGLRPPPVHAPPATQQHLDLWRGQERWLGTAAADQGPLRRAAVGARRQVSEGFRTARVHGPGLEPWLRVPKPS